MPRIYNIAAMKNRRRQLRSEPTECEKILWQHIRKNQISGIRFRRQVSIGGYVMDFYAPSIKLAIEIDGSIHDKQKEYDNFRQSGIETMGIRFLRFSNDQVSNEIDKVLQEILKATK
jgi:very-short-patch-repair endonuclease